MPHQKSGNIKRNARVQREQEHEKSREALAKVLAKIKWEEGTGTSGEAERGSFKARVKILVSYETR